MLLKIFPAYGLENSLLTAILVGLYVRFFFNEWLGWVFSGLVVPGYLACIILLQPASAAVIIAEALCTYLLVRGLSHFLSHTRLGSPLFGRDRFIWLVVFSVGIRVVIEALCAPWFEQHLRARLGLDLSDSFGFYGIGLVLVPLLANACWKPGLLRGSFQQIACTALTYLLLLVLLRTTNLSFAKVAHSFQQTTLDFTASPKAYMLLLAGALVASRANLRFGWDTSGVVIPGLIALAWFSPGRVLATLGEALLIVVAVTLFVRLPRIRDWNIEGPRRVVLGFTFGYIIKLGIVAVFGAQPLGFEPTALFGIGYLLPSLLAVKILQRRNPVVILFPSITLSLVGLVFGSLVGYALLIAGGAIQARAGLPQTQHEEGSCGTPTELVSEVRLARVRAARTEPGTQAPRIINRELRAFGTMLQKLRTLTAQEDTNCSRLAAQLRPGTLGLRLQTATTGNGREMYILHEQPQSLERTRGFGLVAMTRKPSGGPVLILERPEHDLNDLAALVGLADVVNADAIVVGGLSTLQHGRGDVTRDGEVALRVAASALGGRGITVATQSGARSRLSGDVAQPIAQSLSAAITNLLVDRGTSQNAKLELSPDGEQTLALPLSPKLAMFANKTSWLPAIPVVPRVAPTRSAFTDQLLTDEVIRPLSRVTKTTDLTTLGRKVAGAARELGITVALIDLEGEHPAIALFGHGEGLLIDPAAQDGALIQVVSRRLGVAELASALFDAHHARTLLVAVTIPDAPDAGPLARVASPLLALTPPLPPVIIVRAGSQTDASCAIVLDTPTDPSPIANGLAVSLGTIGVHCPSKAQYDADSAEPPSLLIDFLRSRISHNFVTLEVGPELRERFRPMSLSAAQLLLLSRLKVTAVRASVEKLLEESCDARSADTALTVPDPLLEDARDFAATRNPAILERLRARADREQLELRAVDDAERAEVYLYIRGSGGAAAVPMRPPATAAVRLTCSGDVLEKVRQAQAKSAASITVVHP